MAVDGVGLPFKEAIEFFSAKVNLPTRRWDDLRHGAHVRAFSVAGVTRDDMLTDFRAAMDRAMRDLDFDAFRASFDAIVERTGWQFNASGTTPEQRRQWRARIIFDTNIRTAYMAGRYRQMSDPAVARLMPFWRYNHNDSANPRQQHVAWDGLILRHDDPWWQVHYPPNGFGCNCDVSPLSRGALKRLGKDGPDSAPPDRSYTTTDPRTGQEERVFPGVRRGWEYHVGREWTAGVVPPEADGPLVPWPSVRPAGLPPMPAPRPADTALIMPPGLSETTYIDAFLAAFGASAERPVDLRDRSGGIIAIGQDLFEKRDATGRVIEPKVTKLGRERYVRLLAEAILDPDEIWVGWQVPRGTNAVRLVRTYLRRTILPDGRHLFLRFAWKKDGWQGITAYDISPRRIEAERVGVMLYRRADDPPIRSE
jgi:hypothetical protein